MSGTPGAPVLSVVVQVGEGDDAALGVTLASLREQLLADWELILVAPVGAGATRRSTLRSALEGRLPPGASTTVVESDLPGAEARNAALAGAAGTFVTFLPPGDRLAPRTVRALDRVAGEKRSVDVVYADEASGELEEESGRPAPGATLHKPDWSPERLRSQDYLGGAVAYRTSCVREVGGFRAAAGRAADHDLALRVGEVARSVVRDPQALWLRERQAGADVDEAAWDDGRRVVEEHLARTGRRATVRRGRLPGTFELERPLDPDVLVSVVIPTRGSRGPAQDGEVRCYVVDAVRTLLEHAGHEQLEVVVVHDVQTPPRVLRQLRALLGSRLVAVPYDEAFNFSRACNQGVVASHGSVVLLLNDDVEITTDRFLPRLLGPLAEPDVGMTGGKLLYDDSTLQHAGVSMPHRGPWHAFRGWGSDEPGPGGQLAVTREVAGVTGACLAVRRSDYDAVGGLTEELPLSYNDVDLCLKVGALGLRRIWVADAVAFHYESKSRDSQVTAHDLGVLARRWSFPDRDPFFPPSHVAFRRREPA